jgi:hypothetical protein
MKYCDHFRGIVSATIGFCGEMFGMVGHHLMSELPRIFSYAKNKDISVAQYCLIGTNTLEPNHHPGPTTSGRQGHLDLYMGLCKIHF